MENELELEQGVEVASNTLNDLTGSKGLRDLSQPVTPTVVEHKYAAPFDSKIGKSSVDLNNKQNSEAMLEEYNTW